MKAPVWILRDSVLALHERLLAEFGGSSGVRDLGLLDSALGGIRAVLQDLETAPALVGLCFGLTQGFHDVGRRVLLEICHGARFARPLTSRSCQGLWISVVR